MPLKPLPLLEPCRCPSITQFASKGLALINAMAFSMNVIREVFDAVQAIQRLSDVYAQQKDAEALRKLLTELRPLFGVITKAKTAKIVQEHD